MRVRTRRFTKVEHTMTSGITVGTHPKRTDGYQALAFQSIIRHPGLCRQGLRHVPVASAANRRQNRLTLTGPQRQKIADLGAHPAPLLPIAHTDASSDPRVGFRYGSVVIRDAEILHSRRRCASPAGTLGCANRLSCRFHRPRVATMTKIFHTEVRHES
jgi:hypothetical protein